MELATLAGLAPGRVVGGVGHGVQSWMAQIGARQPSPVTALEEVLTAVRRLLAGETVTTAGRFVILDDVTLDRPPDPPPPVLAGVRGPVSLAMAGRCADGLVLAEMTGPTAVREAIASAAARRPFEVVVYTAMSIDDDRRAARRAVAGWIVELVEAAAPPGLRANAFYDDLADLVGRRGVDAVDDFPDDWWPHLGAIGTPDDVAAHLDAARRRRGDDRRLLPAARGRRGDDPARPADHLRDRAARRDLIGGVPHLGGIRTGRIVSESEPIPP